MLCMYELFLLTNLYFCMVLGYAYTQGINSSIMGVLMAAGAVTGMVGTFLYPLFRKNMGLERTGLFSFFFEICFLCLCVASVWAPGSPFDPFTQKEADDASCWVLQSNDSLTLNPNTTITDLTHSNLTTLNNEISSNETLIPIPGCGTQEMSKISVILLMAGIIGARCGT